MFERFRERRPRVGCVVLSLLLSPAFACCAGSAAGMIVPPTEVLAEPGQEAFERELAVAQALGFTVVDQQTLDTDEDAIEVAVALDAGECVAVVGAAWGWVAIGDLSLERGGVAIVDHDPSGMASHVQYCATQGPESLVAMIGLDHQDGILGRAAYSQGTLRYAIARGRRADGLSGLNRGQLTAAGSQRVGMAEVVRRADTLAAGHARLGPPLSISDHRARVVPETAALYAALATQAQNGETTPLRPRVDLLATHSPPAWRPSAAPGARTLFTVFWGTRLAATEVPATVFERTRTAVRALAVIDPSTLGGCIDVQFVRMRYGVAPSVRRQGSAVLAAQGNVVTDHLCGAHAVYVTDASDRDTYELRLLAP